MLNFSVTTICLQFSPPVQQHHQDTCFKFSIVDGVSQKPTMINLPQRANNNADQANLPKNKTKIELEEYFAYASVPVVKGLQKTA